jgi:phage baseplate assembly protein W
VALKISNLEQIADRYSIKPYLYKDWHLDFSKTKIYNHVDQAYRDGNDIEVDYDLNAIINSLKNLFNTKPGQRFLFPLYGLDMYQFLFEPISRINGQMIGERIVRAVDLYEPRVKLLNCSVIPVPDDNTYEVTIAINIPIFNTQASISAIIDQKTQTFIFLETSRNK